MLSELLLAAMKYALEVRLGGREDIQPGVMVEQGTTRTIKHFLAYDDDLNAARRFVHEGRDDGEEFDRAVIFFDAWATREGQRSEAIMFESHERGTSHGLVSGQRYRSRWRDTPEAFGNPFLHDTVEPLIGIPA